MRILVQKFGGSSLSTTEAKERVIQHIKRERDNGYAVVVVVSAIGRRGDPYATDSLLDLLAPFSKGISAREQDVLLSCGENISAVLLGAQIRQLGIPVVVCTAAEAGIETDYEYGSAKIVAIRPEFIKDALQQSNVVVVTGFQGKTMTGEVTTLGRGGSDTTATALGAALGAEFVDIYTDVNGVLTADPAYVTNAKAIAQVSYDEICHMARDGAKVVHPRAVEIAKQARIAVRVRSTFTSDEGTLVKDNVWQHNEHAVLDRHVTGIAHAAGLSQINVSNHPDQDAVSLSVFQTLANHHISVDFINITPSGALFTVSASNDQLAKQLLEQQGFIVRVVPNCAKVSIIGGGMNGQPGVMSSIVEALVENNIEILQSADSNAAIWVLVQEEHMAQALIALHSKFDLHRESL